MRSWPRAVGRAVALGYLFGSFPSADVVAWAAARRGRAERAVDLRSAGSGNPGALNAAQQLGTCWGLVVLSLDAAKGALA